MNPLGYVMMQTEMRLSRPVKAYQKWMLRMPGEYHRNLIGDGAEPVSAALDPYCMGVLRHYQSLMALGHDARKPMFHLKPADGAMGAHATVVERCREDYERLARDLLKRVASTESR